MPKLVLCCGCFATLCVFVLCASVCLHVSARVTCGHCLRRFQTNLACTRKSIVYIAGLLLASYHLK